MTQLKNHQELTTTVLSQLAKRLGQVPIHTRLKVCSLSLSQLKEVSEALEYFEEQERELGLTNLKEEDNGL